MDDLKTSDEKQRNRLFRRVDWRYLLANPKPQKSICFNDGLLQQAVESISSLVNIDKAESGECDLAVAIDPTDKVLQSAFDALGSNGELYTEWYSPFVGGAKGVQQRLEKIGFTDIRCYWAWRPPKFASPLYWLPINSTKVLRYYISNRPTSSSIFVRLARCLLQSLVNLDLADRILFPICVIAKKAGTDHQMSFHDAINTEILNRWQSWEFDKAPSELTWLLWTPGHRLISKVVAMIFSDVQEEPALVVKIPRSDLAAQSLQAEARNLSLLAAKKQASFKGIPSLLFTSSWNEIPVVGEGFIVGAPLYTYLNRDTYRGLALKVTDWLIDLASGSTPAPRSEWRHRLAGSAINDFEQSFRPAYNAQELAYMRTILESIPDLPLCFEQRDCSPWNVLLNSKGEITVLDWESAEPNGLPALDLIYFLTYLAFFVEGAMESGSYIDAYRNTWNPETFTGKINQECQERYCNQVKINIEDLSALRLLTWLIHSRHEYRRVGEDAGSHPTSSALRSSLFSKLIQEETRRYNGV